MSFPDVNEVRCPEGHAVQRGDEFCGRCGTHLAPSPDPSDVAVMSGEEVSPEAVKRPSRVRKWWLALPRHRRIVISGFVALLVAVVVFNALRREPASETVASDSPTPTAKITDPCILAITYWVDQMLTGQATMSDVFLEYGRQDPRTDLIFRIWGRFQADAYRIGRDKASGAAYADVVVGCNRIARGETL